MYIVYEKEKYFVGPLSLMIDHKIIILKVNVFSIWSLDMTKTPNSYVELGTYFNVAKEIHAFERANYLEKTIDCTIF